jgi:hypothetical protein
MKLSTKWIAYTMMIAAGATYAPTAAAAALQLNFDVVVDDEEEGFDCDIEPVDTFFCLPGIEVGDRTTITFEVDTLSKTRPSDEYFDWWGREPTPWDSYAVWSTTIQTHAGPYVPHYGIGGEGWGLPLFELVDGPTDIFSIYSPTSHDSESAGGTWIELHDSTGDAIHAEDLLSQATFENWILNRFDPRLFDSGSWSLTTYDGGGGAWGRVDVPEPSTFALLFFAMLGGVACTMRRRSLSSG